jgi:replicative DNA helicase
MKNIELQDTIIASIMEKGIILFHAYQEFLNPEHFPDAWCRDAWESMERLAGKDKDWKSTLPVYDRSKDKPQWKFFDEFPMDRMMRWLDPLWQDRTSHKDIAQLVAPLLGEYQRLVLLKEIENLKEKAESDMFFESGPAAKEFSDRIQSESYNPFEITHELGTEISSAFSTDLERRMKDRYSAGIPTHLISLNRVIGGLRPSNLIVVGGMTGGGKTAFGVNLIWNALKLGKKVLMISAEMSTYEVMSRLVSLESKVSAEKIIIRPNSLTNKDFGTIHDSLKRFFTKNLFIDDSSMVKVASITRTTHKAQVKMGGLDLVIVDYIQYLKADRNYRSRYEEMTAVTQALKGLAKEFKVPVVAMAQLNRAAHQETPSLKHFQDTSQIEKESDVALILYQVKENDQWVQLLKVDKNRNGRIQTLKVGWNPEIMLFYDLPGGHFEKVQELQDIRNSFGKSEERDDLPF